MSDVDARRFNVIVDGETGEAMCVMAPGGRRMTWKEVDDQLNSARPEARLITSYRADEIDLMVDHYFARTQDFMHAGCQDKIREAVQGIFQDARIGRSCGPQPHEQSQEKP